MEQVINSMGVIRAIESAMTTKSIQVRFYGIQNGTDIWIDGIEWRAFDYDMASFLESHCNLSQTDAELLSTSYDIMATDGFAEDYAMVGGKLYKTFSRGRYDSVCEALNEHEEEVLVAALECGVEFDDISDQYRGKYDTFRQFVKEEWLALYQSELPDFIEVRFIDFETIADDWRHSYNEHEGHIFSLS